MKYALTRSPKHFANFPVNARSSGGFRFFSASLHTPNKRTSITGSEFSTSALYRRKVEDSA